MTFLNLAKSFIVSNFKEFYKEIILCKSMALEGGVVKSQPQEADDVVSLPNRVLDRLEYMLTQQYRDAEQRGGDFAAKYYREAQYIMVCLADEIFLNFEWVGRSEWEENLLESRLFNSHVAGEQFFQNLDKFLKVRDSSNLDLGVLYVLALGLGFMGRYRNTGDEGEIRNYKIKLRRYLSRYAPNIFNDDIALFEEAYEHTKDGSDQARLPNPRRWYWMTFLAVFLFIVGSSGVWFYHTHEVASLLRHIAMEADKGGI